MSKWIGAAAWSAKEARVGDRLPYARLVDEHTLMLRDGALQPDYSGVRPKLQASGEPAADFALQDAEAHGRRGLVSLYGIESPGLTSSLYLAQRVRAMLDGERSADDVPVGVG